MKKILVLLSMTLIPILSNAKTATATDVADLMQDVVLSFEGVNGIGITGCNAKTGAMELKKGSVDCVVIYTETEDAFAGMKAVYPVDTKIKGVFIVVDFLGEVTPQPRMSGGS